MKSDIGEIPVACNLTGAEYAMREEEVIANIFGSCEQVQELSDGYAFRFPGDEQWAARLLQFVIEERKCCPFFTFNLLFEPEKGPIWLQLRGDERVKLFVKENFQAKLPIIAMTARPQN